MASQALATSSELSVGFGGSEAVDAAAKMAEMSAGGG